MTSAAMIFGTDAVGSPAPPALPTGTEAWFNEGGNGADGTQVPHYWVNKVGGEISAAIVAVGQTLIMGNYNQLGYALGYTLSTLINLQNQVNAQAQALQNLHQSVTTVPPQTGSRNTNLTSGGGGNSTPYSFTLSLTAPANGYVLAISGLAISGGLAAGAALRSSITLSGSGVTQTGGTADDNPLPQTEFTRGSVTAGAQVTATFTVSSDGNPPAQEFQQDGTLFFYPSP